MSAAPRLRIYNHPNDDGPHLRYLSPDQLFEMDVVARVLPFRINNYVVEELIDWKACPDDPIFRLTFPDRDMLHPADFARIAALLRSNAPDAEIDGAVHRIRLTMNPHPAGQLTQNVPVAGDEIVPGVQHKYRQTVLVFPSAGQTCHAYCTFCFRWPQFVDMPGMRFATDQSNRFWTYLAAHREVTDVLLTGGDPMVMAQRVLARYIEPVFSSDFEHITTIRIGTKALAYWPYRFTTDRDADDLLRLFERVVRAGKHLAFMAHFDHVQELQTPAVVEAIRRIRNTGAEIRTQAPVLHHINDSATAWSDMWRRQVQLGCIPYYMFVMRDTGAQAYFQVTLERAARIYREACAEVSGLGRTARGPTMATEPGKVVVDGVADVRGEKVFVLSFLQARDPAWIKRIFFARYDPDAVWLSDLRPAFGEEKFGFEATAAPSMIAAHEDCR